MQASNVTIRKEEAVIGASHTPSSEQIAPAFETDTPHLRALETMVKKRVSLRALPLAQATTDVPVLSTRHLPSMIHETFKPSTDDVRPKALIKPRLTFKHRLIGSNTPDQSSL